MGRVQVSAFFFHVFVFIVPGCGTFFSGDKDAAQMYLEVGTSQLQAGAYPQGLASLLKAESLDPKNPVIQNNLGLAYFVREYYTKAEVHIRKAISLDEMYSDAYNNLGRTLIELGKYPEAIDVLQKAAKDLTYVSPEKPLLNLGIAYFRMKRFDMAVSHLRRSIDIQRENCIARSYLGRSYFEKEEYLKAAQELDRATSYCQRSQFDEPIYYAALSYYELGKQEIAIVRLEELIKIYSEGKYRDRAKSMIELMKR